MAQVISGTTNQASRPKMDRTFIGRAWVNTTADGKVYINMKLDKGVKVELDENSPVQFWANTKREGKKDADYRASILISAQATA